MVDLIMLICTSLDLKVRELFALFRARYSTILQSNAFRGAGQGYGRKERGKEHPIGVDGCSEV